MIKELCHRLKEKRRELGFTIEYTVEKTKLHPSVIKDIEDCNLNNVGSVLYLKGFIKIYASFLGIDLGTSLEEIDSMRKPQETSKKDDIIEKKEKKEESPSLGNRMQTLLKQISPEVKKRIIAVVLGIVLLWFLISLVTFIVRKIPKVFKKPHKVQASSMQQEEKVTLPIGAADEMVVSLTAKKKCFLRVRVDGKLLFEGILDRGVTEAWKGNKEIEFKISDGSAVLLEVNGKVIPTLTSIRKPIKSLKITPSGISVDK